MGIAHDCFSAVAAALYGPQQRWRGFRTPPLIRFVKGETGLLSPTNGGARVYINLEDCLSRAAFGATNQDFQAVWTLLRSPTCKGRMHWGKDGWPSSSHPEWAFNGFKEYPHSWCDFGCAVHDLDPKGKFRALSSSTVFAWPGPDFDKCCTPDGFLPSCSCVPGTAAGHAQTASTAEL